MRKFLVMGMGTRLSYVTLQLLPSEFPYVYKENFILFFISVSEPELL